MSEPSFEDELPDDIELWPTDPATLFGVAATASRRDLKRAYSRLIRRFKPEHAPDQFRRLREAYEQFDRQLEWRELFEQRQVEAEFDPQAGGWDSNADTSAVDPAVVHPASGVTSDFVISHKPDAEPIWHDALSGADVSSVYRKLVEFASQQTPSEIDFARLYWLLTIDPLIDPQRDSVDWLIQGLRTHGFENRLLTMLSIDVRRRQGDVPALLDLKLDELNCSPRRLLELMQSRWMVVRNRGCFERINDDISQVQRRFFDAPFEWQMLLLAGVRQLLLVPTAAADTQLTQIRAELDQLTLNADSHWLWDWYESSVSLQLAWKDTARKVSLVDVSHIGFIDLHGRPARIQNASASRTLETLRRLSKLAQTTWSASTALARDNVVPFCVELLKEPASGLRELAAINQVARPLLLRFFELLREQLDEFVDLAETELTAATEKLLARFVQGTLWRSEPWQFTVLDFCLREAVTPLDVARALQTHGEDLPASRALLIEVLQSDLPLNCLVNAQRLLW